MAHKSRAPRRSIGKFQKTSTTPQLFRRSEPRQNAPSKQVSRRSLAQRPLPWEAPDGPPKALQGPAELIAAAWREAGVKVGGFWWVKAICKQVYYLRAAARCRRPPVVPSVSSEAV